MDLSRFIRVAWRFRAVLAVGLVLATSIAIFATGKIVISGGKPTFKFRQDQVYVSASTLLVTQDGFPWGRAILDDMITVDGANGTDPVMVPRFGDPGRYSGLASLYVELAKGDAVRARVMKGLPPGSSYEPAVVKDPDSGTTMPLLYLKGYGSSPGNAASVANRAADEFQAYLREQQRDSGIAPDKRVEVVVTKHADDADLFTPRSYVRPIMLFLVVVIGFIALAFALENMRPLPMRAVAFEDDPDAPDAEPNGRPPRRDGRRARTGEQTARAA